MKTGAACAALGLASEQDLRRINEAGLELLEGHGILCESEAILAICKKGGAKVERSSKTIRLGRGLIEEALRKTPKSFVLNGIDPEMDLLVKPGLVYFGMGGSSEPFYLRFRARPCQEAHQIRHGVVHPGGSEPNEHRFHHDLCTSGDVPVGQAFYHDIATILRNTTKPMVFTMLDRKYAKSVIEMASAAAGGEAASGNGRSSWPS